MLTCEKCELTCKGGRKLIDTHGFVQGIYLQTLWEKIHTIVGAVTWQSVLVLKRQSNVKIALLSSTQRVIWKFTWLTKVVKSNATSVIKHWNVKVIWKSTSHIHSQACEDAPQVVPACSLLHCMYFLLFHIFLWFREYISLVLRMNFSVSIIHIFWHPSSLITMLCTVTLWPPMLACCAVHFLDFVSYFCEKVPMWKRTNITIMCVRATKILKIF